MSFTDAWLADEPRARQWLPLDPWRPDDRRRAVETAAARPLPDAVREVLARQVPRWSETGTAAVVTGQQAGLFLGPLYTIFKAAHAIAAARALGEETGRPVLPVFWVASEDHDLAEIAWCSLPGSGDDEPVVRLAIEPPDDQPIPVARRTLGADVTQRIERLRAELAGLPHAGEVSDLLARHYRSEATFVEAFCGVLGEVFEGSDLAIVDPREPALLDAALPAHRRAFGRATEISRALLDRVSALEEAGFDAPVHVRDGAPLSFVHPDDEDGPRFRVAPAEDGWRLVGAEDRVLERSLVARWLEHEPARFSSSALLRPLVQDLVLPTAGYVGGPGEIRYLAQTPPLYEAWERPMPLLLPRARFRIIGPTERRLCEQLGVDPDDASLPRAQLLALAGGESAHRKGLPDPDRLESELLEGFRASAGAFVEPASRLDDGLGKALARTRGAVEDRVGKLVDRYRRTLAERDAVIESRVARLAGALAPDGAPQERVHGFASFAARTGVRTLRDRLVDACELLPTTCRDLET